jgi:hypothetical protein
MIVMEFTQLKEDRQRVSVTFENLDEEIDMLCCTPSRRWLGPGLVRLNLEIVGIKEPSYPRSKVFTREELARAATVALSRQENELAEHIIEFFRAAAEVPVRPADELASSG